MNIIIIILYRAVVSQGSTVFTITRLYIKTNLRQVSQILIDDIDVQHDNINILLKQCVSCASITLRFNMRFASLIGRGDYSYYCLSLI